MLDSAGSRYPVPVRIRNINANSDNQPTDSSEFQRRFNLVNTIIGKETGTLKYVRLPVSIQMWLKKASDAGKITVPILDIKYLDYSIGDLQDPTKQVQFLFSSSYIIDFSSERNVLVIIFAVIASLAFLTALVKTRSWYTRNHQSADVIDLLVLFFN